MKQKTLTCLIAACTAVGVMPLDAATYYWKGATGDSAYGNWTDISNWSTEGVDGADATAAPGASDTFYGLQDRSIDLEGESWSIGGWDSTGNWASYTMNLRNGTLNVVGDVTTHADVIGIRNGAKLVFAAGKTFTPAIWDGGKHCQYVHSGGEVDILGRLRIYNYGLVVYGGGTAVVSPTKVDVYGDTAQKSYFQNDGGRLSLPSGIEFSSGSTSAGFKFSLIQNSGTLELGGSVDKNGKPGEYVATFAGGTVVISNDVSFALDSATMPANASITLEILDDSSVDMSPFTYGSGASISMTGAGDFLFTNGMALPDTFEVAAGAIVLNSADTAYDISGVSFSGSGKIKIGATGITLSAWDSSISGAAFVAASGFSPASGLTVFTCTDATVLAQAQAGLNATLPSGLSVAVTGNSLVAESHYTFNSTTVTDMTDPDGWLGGAAGVAGQPVIVAGTGVAPVMDGSTPAYASVTVADGASLTVSASRNLPATTLAAGTALNIVGEASSVVLESRSYNDYIMDTATFVGTMSPSRSLSEITDISGNVGGGWFGNTDKLYTYVNAKVLDNGTRLHVQFIRNETDWTKCAIVDFTKDSQGNIYATGVGAGYVSPTSAQIDFDEIEYTAATYGTSDTSGAYGVKKLSFKVPVVSGGASTVVAVGDFATTGTGTVTVNVEDGSVLDLSGVTVTTAAKIVKTGLGTIAFGDAMATSMDVDAGVLAVKPYVEYDMGGVTLDSSVSVKVAIDGVYKPAFAKAGPNNKTVYIAGATYVGIGGWNMLSNWSDNSLPDSSATVHVHGSGTILTLDDEGTTMPAAIVVEDGATLSVVADVTLPSITLAPTAKLVLGDETTDVNVTLTAAPDTLADTSVTPAALPILEVTTNATLNLPGGTKFKNVNLRLFGALVGNTLGRFYFGHAVAGEDSYFAMCSTNATITTIGRSDAYDYGSLYFVCPDASGTVHVVGTIELDGLGVERFTSTSGGDSQYNGINFGVNNPTNVPFSVMFTNFSYWYLAQCSISGAANLILRDSLLYRRPNRAWAAQGRWTISGLAKVIYEKSEHFYEYPDGNSIGWNSDVTGTEAVVLTNSTVMWSRPAGNHKSMMTVYDSYYDCAYDAYASSQGQTLPDLLQGLGTLNIPEGSFCAIRAKDHVTWGANDDATERICKIDAQAKFAGAGDLVVSNSVSGRYFEVTMQSGSNVCTGDLKVFSPEGFKTQFFFADGANWAGTVVAGNVALTNLTDGAAAAAATFGALDLAADFPLRVWKTGGVVATNDVLKVDSFAGTEKIDLVEMDEALVLGDKVVIGKVKSTLVLPKVGRRFVVKAGEPDEDGYCDLTAQYPHGLQIIVR